MLRVALVLTLTAAAAAAEAASPPPPCTVGPSIWTGGKVPINVSAEDADGRFVASAQGAWQDAPGQHFANGTIFLLDGPPGITGVLTAACTRIVWNDGVGSVWTRPAPLKPYNATISNLLPRRDDTGAILRVQDGCLQNFGGKFYMYGARYQCCPVDEQPACYSPCGWRNATFAVYSSPDLETWHLESADIFPVISGDPDGPHSNTRNAYFEPCVMYSEAADHYVLWYLNTNTKATAVSDSPTGPFESVAWSLPLAQGSDSYCIPCDALSLSLPPCEPALTFKLHRRFVSGISGRMSTIRQGRST